MHKYRFADSILFRLLLSAVGLVIFGAVMRYTVLTKFLRDDLESLAASQQLALANYVAQDIDQSIRLHQTWLNNLAAAIPPELMSKPERLRVWLGERYDLLPMFSRGVLVVEPKGSVITDYPVIPGRTSYDTHQIPGVEAVLSTKSGVGRPLMSPLLKKPILPFVARIRNAKGTVVGTLVGIETIESTSMFNLLLNGRIGETGGFLLISPQDAMFVASSDPAMVLKPTPPPGVNSLHDRAMAGYRGTGITINAKGIEELSAMASVPSSGWFLVARMPTAEAFATVGNLKAFLLRNTLIVIVIALLLVSTAAWWLLKPLRDAAQQADRMTGNEISFEPLKVVRNDEVGQLTSAFNRLLLKLVGSQEALEHLAHHDTLTGLPNRRLLADRLKQALARAQRNHLHLAVLFLDLDGFKPINDTLGHEAGDEALFMIAERFSSVIRKDDTLARVGGDEFVLVASDLSGKQEEVRQAVETIAAKCLSCTTEPLMLRSSSVCLGVSIGIVIGDGNSTTDDLLTLSDKAMYEAKRLGRGRYVFA